ALPGAAQENTSNQTELVSSWCSDFGAKCQHLSTKESEVLCCRMQNKAHIACDRVSLVKLEGALQPRILCAFEPLCLFET
ncbi:MAG TPA: hypothetical protein PKK15_21670, partial [Kouleothrix sp.]|nr:hypothetical protein [Kouleothrix sp.]